MKNAPDRGRGMQDDGRTLGSEQRIDLRSVAYIADVHARDTWRPALELDQFVRDVLGHGRAATRGRAPPDAAPVPAAAQTTPSPQPATAAPSPAHGWS